MREEQILNDYIEGMSLKDIKKKYKTGSDTIYKIVDRSETPRRNSKDLSKFYNLNNPETQYWLGYICADGSVQFNTKHRVYKVSLFSKDEIVIQKFKEYFGSIVNIHKRPSGIIEGYINSKELANYFITKLNIPENKGLILDPNIEMTKEFVLGYFDGDGSITNSSKKRTRYEAKFTCGSKEFINKLCKVLDGQNIYYVVRPKGNAFDIAIDRKNESEKLYNWMYSTNVWSLPRKLNNFVALFGSLGENNRENCGELNGQSAAELPE